MFPVREAQTLAPDVVRLVVEAPRVARYQHPGQFVIVRVREGGERIPLTIAGADAEAGTITLIIQAVGLTTRLLCALQPGQAILDVTGPLGAPSEVGYEGRVAVVAGGVGSAIAYPRAAALARAGNELVTILGARTGDLLTLEDELASVSASLRVVTDDGSRGRRGLVTDVLADDVEAAAAGIAPLDLVLTAGPVPMMGAVADVTRPHGIPTVASLNPLMVDGTGMCGGCRVQVAGATAFACVDGPEFDAHQVDFALLHRRNQAYRDQERAAAEAAQAAAEAAQAEAEADDGCAATQPQPRPTLREAR